LLQVANILPTVLKPCRKSLARPLAPRPAAIRLAHRRKHAPRSNRCPQQ